MLTLFHGSDRYRLKEAVDAFVASHRAKHNSVVLALDLAIGDGLDQLEQAVATPSFFGERRLVLARDPLSAPDVEECLKRCGAATAEDADIVIVQQTAVKISAGHAKELAKIARLAHTVVTCEPHTATQALQWMHQFCEQRGRSLESGAAQELLRRVDTDGWALANELEKLCAYSDGAITAAAVAALVAQPPAADQWELSNALAGRDKRTAVAALWRKVREGTPEPLLVGALASALRTLLIVRDLADRGQVAATIAKTSGLHPFVVSKNLAGARAYAPEALHTAHRALAELDRNAKEGRADATDGLFAVLLTL